MRRLLPCLAAIVAVHAQTDTPLTNIDSILRELDTIEDRRVSTVENARTQALAKLNAAASSGNAAVGLFEDAVKGTQFAGTTGSARSFEDWKEKREDLLRSKQLQTAAQLHVRYLILSMQRAKVEKASEMIDPTMAYVKLLAAADPVLRDGNPSDEQKQLMENPVTNGTIAKWLNLGPMLTQDKDWEASAGNLAGILDKNVRAVLRAEKDPRLLDLWETQMQIEADRATKGNRSHAIDQFNLVQRPRLIALRAEDMILLGTPNRAVSEFVAIIRAHPEHPDCQKWIDRVRAILKPPTAS